MGHAPNLPDGSGRADVRVVDQNCNPVKDAKAKLDSIRPNGFFCDSSEVTDAGGRALLPPLHIGTINLSIQANGFQPLQMALNPEQLAQPIRVILAANGSQQQSRLVGILSSVASSGQCFDFYRLFISYVTSELGMARTSFSKGKMDEASKHFNNILLAAGAKSGAGNTAAAYRFRAAARTGLGDIAFRAGNYTEALQLYTDAVEGARKDQRPDLVWAAQRGMGRTLWALSKQKKDPRESGQLQTDSLKAYQEAINTIETLLAGGLRSDEARTSFLATTKDVYDEAASAFAELALQSDTPNSQTLSGAALTKAAMAFQIAEQGRARSLLDLLSETSAEIMEGLAPELIKRKLDIQARQLKISQQLSGVGTEEPSVPVEKLEAELKNLDLDRITIENQIRVSSPRYAELSKPQPISLQDVQQKVLDENTVLLEYSIGPEHSYLWVVTRSGVMLYRLPARPDIDKLTEDFRSNLIPYGLRRSIIMDAGNEATRGLGIAAQNETPEKVRAYRGSANSLYKMVVEPAASLIKDKHLLIVADGALNYIPFEALTTSEEGTAYDSLAYLIKTNEVSYAPSASVIAALKQRSGGVAAGGGVLLIADPVFDASDERAKGSTANVQTQRGISLQLASAVEDVAMPMTGQALKLRRLPGTRKEAEQISKLTTAAGRQADALMDSAASETNLTKRDLRQYRVIHFATHGILDMERPQYTGLALSPIEDRDNDGFLRVDEVFNLRLNSQLVMLSACETGIGKQRRGEGVIGLARAFMYAGAQTVGVSLWSVADQSTAELMTSFYANLLAPGQASSSVAFRKAKQEMIAGKRYSAPFYWAPFITIGE
jgi:CHAT domain-containing protein